MFVCWKREISQFILGDKGYVGEALTRELSDQGICLMALKRSNSKADWPKSMRQLIFKLRRRVETVFSQLNEQLNAERVLAKSFRGLCTRLANKILGYNLCLVINSIFHETCELGKIKQLIFWDSKTKSFIFRGYFGLLQVFNKIWLN